MESDEPRFLHIGLSSDGAVVFCEMDNGKTYAMPLHALEHAETWNAKARPNGLCIIHDGFAAVVNFNNGAEIDFPTDFVLSVCEPRYSYYQGNGHIASGIGACIREIRQGRGLTLEALADKCGIAKPNLSRLENDRVTPTFETLQTIAAALDTHPMMLVSEKKPKHAWTWTRHAFMEWRKGLRGNEPGDRVAVAPATELIDIFLARRPEHAYARSTLMRQSAKRSTKCFVDAAKWAREKALAQAARRHANRLKRKA